MNKYILKGYLDIAKMTYNSVIKPIGEMTLEVGKSAYESGKKEFKITFTEQDKKEIKESVNVIKTNINIIKNKDKKDNQSFSFDI